MESPEKTMNTPGEGSGPPPPLTSTGARVRALPGLVVRWVGRHRWFVLAAGLYVIPVLIASRLEIFAGPGQFPQGTNALNEFLFFYHWKTYPLQTWYSPYTDWGIPLPGYTGPTVLYAGTLTLNPSTLVRIVELTSLWLSGVTAYILCRNLGSHALGAGLAGFYYMLQAETPQFFEGHVPFMISVAIAPVFLLSVYRFGARLSLGWGLMLAVLLYLLASIGDLGALYFLLFVSIPLLAFSILWNRSYRGIRRSQVFAVACSVGLFLALMAPWWVPFLFGVRPQYTTGITVAIPPFGNVRAEPMASAYAGISIENSFTHFALGQATYTLDYPILAPVYFVIPVIITLYVLLKRTVGRLVLYGAGLLVMLISTGSLYPGVSAFNDFLYTHVPYFDYVPNFPNWLFLVAVVYTIFLAWLITDLAVASRTTRPSEPVSRTDEWEYVETTRASRRGVTYTWSVSRTPDRWRTLRGSRRQVALTALVVVTAFVVVSVAMQDEEIFSSPPLLFSFPSGYVDGYEYIATQPETGGTLTVPFGAIYERTPWGGVSASTEVMATYYTHSNAVVFEAGTPYSLAMDDLIHQALQEGTSDNLTKFLAGSNIQFVTSTDYPSWSQSSSSLGSPKFQYEHLTQQVGLGTPVFSGGFQTVYELANPAGNLSFHPSYYVYFGNDSLVNELLNQPFYNGSEPLVNGLEVESGSLPILLTHAAALIVSPATLSTLPAADLSLALANHVPVILLAGADDVTGSLVRPVSTLWNASNGLVIQPPLIQTPVDYAFNQSILTAAGVVTAAGSVRASCPPGAVLTFIDNSTQYELKYVNPSTTYAPLNLTNGSAVTAGIENGGRYPYNGSVTVSSAEGRPYLLWNLTGDNTTYQYLTFAVHNLTGDDGLTFTLARQPGLPTSFLMQIFFGDTWVNVTGYHSIGAPGSNGVAYTFDFSTATGPGEKTFEHSLGKITGFRFGPEQTYSASHLNVSALSYLQSVVGAPFENVPTPSITLNTLDEVGIKTTSECRLDTIALAAGGLDPHPTSFVSYKTPQSEPLVVSAESTISGWGLLLASDTYSPIWQLSIGGAPSGTHLVANLGLNAWLVNLTPGERLVVSYLGQQYQTDGIIIEVVGIPVVAGVILTARFAKIRARRKRIRNRP